MPVGRGWIAGRERLREREKEREERKTGGEREGEGSGEFLREGVGCTSCICICQSSNRQTGCALS